MNGLDYLILAVIALGAIHGSSRGILRIASSLIALVAGVYLASLYSHQAGAYLTRVFSVRPGTGTALGYVIILLMVIVVVAWGGDKVAQLIRAVHMSWVDRLGGALVGAALGALGAGLGVGVGAGMLPGNAPFIRPS